MKDLISKFVLVLVPILIFTTFLQPVVVHGRLLQQEVVAETKLHNNNNNNNVIQVNEYNNQQQQFVMNNNNNNNKHKHKYNRNIQEVSSGGVEYRAKYIAEYQYLRDPLCLGPSPELRLFCLGDIEITSTSHPSINCTVATTRQDDGWITADCINTCIGDTECRDVYLNLGGSGPDVGPFANITYECYGSDYADVNAAFGYLNSGNGACVASRDTRNFHVARMGILCDDNNDEDSVYSYDDYYFECSPLSASIFPQEGFPDGKGNIYTCFVGENCQGASCDVEFDRLIIDADLPNFQDTCITPTVPKTEPPKNIDDPTINLGIQALFQTAWTLEFDEFTGSQCTGYTPTVRITCINSNIEYVNSTSTTMDCNQTDSNTLDCIDTSAFINAFTGVNYTCTGASLPQTKVEYPQLDAYCDGNTLEATVSEKLQLGVFCDIEGGFYFWGDYYVECGTVSSEFQWIDDLVLDVSQYTCIESVNFPVGSTIDDTKTLPTFSITTDADWVLNPDESCYEFITLSSDDGSSPSPVTTTPAPTIDTSTSQPTASPTSAATTVAPLTTPTASATTTEPSEDVIETTPSPAGTDPVQTTVAPTQVPANNPDRNVPIVDEPSDSSDGSSSSSIGGIVGGVVGGVVAIAVVALAVFYFKSRSSSNGAEPKQPVTTTANNNDFAPPPAAFGKQNSQTDRQGGNYSSGSNGDDMDDDDMPTEPTQIAQPIMPSSPPPVEHVPSSSNTHRTSRTRTTATSSSHNTPHSAMPAPPPPTETVSFKDQARTVIASAGDDVPIVEGVAVPMYDVDGTPRSPSRGGGSGYRTHHSNNSNSLPMDTSTSDISDGTGFTGFTRRSAEPDGRHAGVDP